MDLGRLLSFIATPWWLSQVLIYNYNNRKLRFSNTKLQLIQARGLCSLGPGHGIMECLGSGLSGYAMVVRNCQRRQRKKKLWRDRCCGHPNTVQGIFTNKWLARVRRVWLVRHLYIEGLTKEEASSDISITMKTAALVLGRIAGTHFSTKAELMVIQVIQTFSLFCELSISL